MHAEWFMVYRQVGVESVDTASIYFYTWQWRMSEYNF